MTRSSRALSPSHFMVQKNAFHSFTIRSPISSWSADPCLHGLESSGAMLVGAREHTSSLWKGLLSPHWGTGLKAACPPITSFLGDPENVRECVLLNLKGSWKYKPEEVLPASWLPTIITGNATGWDGTGNLPLSAGAAPVQQGAHALKHDQQQWPEHCQGTF